MDAPKCRICETKHWSSESCQFSEDTEISEARKRVTTPAAVPRTAGPQSDSIPAKAWHRVPHSNPKTQVERNRKWRSGNREAYNKYMRDYRRNPNGAKKKETKPTK